MVLSELQKGIVIIDSPGVGESDEMDEMVINYLPKAFAFIYVANSTIAGGVKKDRVSTWIQYCESVPAIYTDRIEARPVPLALIKWEIVN